MRTSRHVRIAWIGSLLAPALALAVAQVGPPQDGGSGQALIEVQQRGARDPRRHYPTVPREPNNPVECEYRRALPGSQIEFVITIENPGAVKLPRVRITDQLVPSDPNFDFPLIPGSIRATLDDKDVTACIAPKFAAALASGEPECYWFSGFGGQTPCLSENPWIAPGQKLTIRYRLQVPEDFDIFGQDVDLTNHVVVEGLTEVCVPSGSCEADAAFCSQEAVETVDVRPPRLECSKRVAADYGNDGSIDVPFTDAAMLANVSFPLRLIYEYEVRNTGDVNLAGVRVCDPLLVRSGADPSVDAIFQFCSLCLGPCEGLNDTCTAIGGMLVGAVATRRCELIIASQKKLEALFDLDHDGDPNCFTNTATAYGNSITTGLCVPPRETQVISQECAATLCAPPGFQGCTPGFWRNHPEDWPPPFSPGQDFDHVFSVDAFDPNKSLMQAVELGGGGLSALARHGVAALLNAAAPDVNYPIGVADVIELVRLAIQTGGSLIEQTKDLLEGYNEANCPL